MHLYRTSASIVSERHEVEKTTKNLQKCLQKRAEQTDEAQEGLCTSPALKVFIREPERSQWIANEK